MKKYNKMLRKWTFALSSADKETVNINDTCKNVNPVGFSLLKRVLFILILLFPLSLFTYGQSQTFNYTGSSQNFTVPAGVTSITVECWGAGGGGGSATANNTGNAGGGGGGAYASSVIAVTPGSVLPLFVGGGGATGNNGENSTFNTNVVVAAGGTGVTTDANPGGAGGTVAASTGSIINRGGNGGTATDARWWSGGVSGGGGGGAGSTGDGGDASSTTAGTGTAINGGDGAAGWSGATERNGSNGLNYGGGGSGAHCTDNTNHTGGSGANGLVIITWSVSSTAYYSQNSGNPGTLSNWNSNPAGGGTTPSSFTADEQSFIIQAGHNMSTTGTWTVSGINSSVQITDGASIIANNAVSISTLYINDGGTYTHNINGGTIPTAVWGAGSTCEITGITTTSPGGINQTFGNFTWNCAGQGANNRDVSFADGTTFQGNFTVTSTGTTGSVRLSNNTLKTLNVNGDLIISGGTLNMIYGTTNGRIQTINLAGDFNMSGGTITETNTGGAASAGSIVFSGTTTQNFIKTAGTISNTINFSVNSGSVLDMDDNVMNGSIGSFTLNAGAELISGHQNGTSITGNIQLTGTRTFNTGADYTFNYSGTGTQNTGTGFTGGNNVTISSAEGAVLTANAIISGTLTLDNTFNISGRTLTLNGPAIAGTPANLTTNNVTNLIFGGTSTGIVIPSSVTTLNNLTINNSNGVSLASSSVLSGNLALDGGSLALGDNNISVTGAITSSAGFDNTHMIITEGSGSLIKLGTLASNYQITYPLGTGTYYTPMVVSTLTAGSYVGNVTVRAVTGRNPNLPLSYNGLLKYWIVSTSGITSITDARVTFEYDAAGEVVGSNADYEPRIWDGASFITPANPTAAGVNPFGTTVAGNTILDGEWTAIDPLAKTTYYSYRNGNWNLASTWTLDPSGALYVNPSGLYPGAADKAVIFSGRTVTMTNNTTQVSSVTVEGVLDLAATVSHTFDNIAGSGKIKISTADNFPSYSTNTLFTTDKGTVEYYGNSFTLTTPRTIYNLEVSMTAGQILTFKATPYTVSGSLTIKSGTFRMNDDLVGSTTPQYLTVMKDITVNLGASFRVGRGNTLNGPVNENATGSLQYYLAYNSIDCYGNFTNNGIVRFTNQDAPDYNSFTTTGAVSLFMKGASENNLTCNDTTDLYYLVVDKGADQSYVLTAYASNEAYFRLYGRNNMNENTSSPFTLENPELRKALWIRNGTFRITGYIFIPSLTEGGGDYYIPANGMLWIDGINAKVWNTDRTNPGVSVGGVQGIGVDINTWGPQSFSIYGDLKVSKGFFTTGSHGIVLWYQPTTFGGILIEGGQCDIPGIRTANGNTAGKFSFTQTGGLVRFLGSYGNEALENFASLCIRGTDCSFGMTGGTMEFYDGQTGANNDITATGGIIRIETDPTNINVTGGTVNVIRNNSNYNNQSIYTTAPFYNLILTGASASTLTTDINTEIVVLNDLTINDYSTLNANNNNVTIGGDFTLGNTTTTNNAVYIAGTNTTTFNGNQNSVISVANTNVPAATGTAAPLNFYELVIDKTAVTPASNAWSVSLSSPGRSELSTDQANRLCDIRGDFLINEGKFNYYRYKTRLYGNYTSYGTSLGDPTSTGRITLENGTSQYMITGSTSSTTAFGDLELNDTDGALLNTHGSFNGFILTAGIIDIGNYNMLITGSNGIVNGNGVGFSTTKMIKSYGSAASQGLTLTLSLSGTYVNQNTLIPVGVGGVVSGTGVKYTPLTINLNGDVGIGPYNGTLNLRPVDEYHPTSDPMQVADLIPYYWKVMVTGNLSSANSTVVRFTLATTSTPAFNYGNGKKHIFYRNNDWTELANASNPLVFNQTGFYDTDYSAGKKNAFKVIQFLYSRQSGPWNDVNTWSTSSHNDTAGDDIPGTLNDYDVRQIGGSGVINHQVTVPAATTALTSKLIIQGKSETGISAGSPPSLIVTAGTSGHDFYFISGNGRFVLNDGTFPGGDFTDFCLSDEAIFEYSGGTYAIPSNLTVYPTLAITGSTDSEKTLPDADILVRKNLNIYDPVNTGVTLNLSSGIDGDLTINDSLVLTNQSKLVFQNGANNHTVNVLKNIDCVTGGAAIVNSIEVAAGGTFSTPTHQLNVQGDINIGASTLTLWRSNAAKSVDLEFYGNTDSRIFSSTASNNIVLSKLTINKSTDALITLFDEEFSINAPTNTATKPLDLQNGILTINNSLTDVTLSSGGGNFTIPSTASLILNNGTLDISGDNTGLNLEGKLEINGGSVSIYNASSINNYIQYYTTGNSEIVITGGLLRVGSQIRRLTTTTGGILNYNQSGGILEVGYSDAPVANRGVFEVLTGSQFSFTGGSLTILKGQTSASVPSFYLDLDAADATIDPGTTLNIGGGSGSPEIGIYSSIPLHHLTISGTGTPTAKMWTVPLDLNGNLTINSGATFNANGLNLTIKGDFTNSGTFTHNSNTTIFNGSLTQTITGITTFYNLTKPSTNNLQLASNIQVNNDLTISGGTFSDMGYNIRVLNDVLNSATHVYGGAIGSSTQLGIYMKGTLQQVISGSGTFGKITVDNSSGVTLPVGSSILITDALRLNIGVFDIQGNLLALDLNCAIEGSGFNENKMIQTNVSFTDNGVKKTFPQNASTFLFPIGSIGKYTPVTFNVTANANNSGTITVKAANEIHPSCINNDTEASCQLVDADNVLQYHWILKSSGISGFSSTCLMQGEVSDIKVSNACGLDETDYITARLLANNTNWNKFDASKFDETTAILTFDFNGTDDDGIIGEYTAGLDDAIPDQVAAYETIGSGDWTNQSIWQAVPITGPAVPVGGPRGSIAIINPTHTVDVTSDGDIYLYRAQINGTLNLNETYAHRLGYVIGTGILRMVDMNNVPAGDYSGTNGFFTATGGTLEYAGTSTYTVLSPNIMSFHSVLFSGSGIRELPNIDLSASGDITISGPDVKNIFNQSISILGNLSLTSGTYYAGVEAVPKMPTITFTGTNAQTISGSFTDANSSALYNVEINKSASNVTLLNAIEITDNLTLTSGNIVTTSANILTLTTALTTVTGGSSSSFIDGPLKKGLDNGDDFTFPVGKGTRYGYASVLNAQSTITDFYWIAEYFNSAYSDLTYQVPLTAVSNTEYWKINSPINGYTGTVKLRWDPLSDISPLSVSGGYTDVRVAEFNGADWVEKASGSQTNNNYNGTVQTSSVIPINVASNPQYYTLGAFSTILAKAYFTTLDDVCEGTSIPVSFSGVVAGDLNFTLSYSIGGVDQADVSVPSLTYSLPVSSAGIYRLNGFTYNGGTIGAFDSSPVTVNMAPAQPTITAIGEPASLTFCEGGNVILTSSLGTTYLWSTGATTQNINAITSGNYTVRVTNASGCLSIVSDPKTVTVNPLPAVTVSAVPGTICFGETSDLTATGGGTYLWSPNGDLDSDNIANPVFDPSITGTNPIIPTQVTTTFTVTVTNAGCSNTGTVDVVVTRIPETGPQFHIDNTWGN